MNANPYQQADSRPVLVIGSDDFAACPDCSRRLDVEFTDAGDAPRTVAEDEAGPIHFGRCPEHGGYRWQIEAEPAAPAGPVCAKCGNDGGESSLYLTIDAKWDKSAGAWELEEREDDGGGELDCLNCDHRTPVMGAVNEEAESFFPYGLMLQPPGARCDLDSIGAAKRAEWRAEQGQGMTSAVGEYTPGEFWELLNAYESLLAKLQPPGATLSAAERSVGAGDLVSIIADGLDACTDGRGWDGRHQTAADLANAAPELLAMLRDIVAGNYGQPHGVTVPALDPARALLAKLQPEWGAA